MSHPRFDPTRMRSPGGNIGIGASGWLASGKAGPAQSIVDAARSQEPRAFDDLTIRWIVCAVGVSQIQNVVD